jgi:hypothetical protein
MQEFVDKCTIYKHAKSEHVKYPGLLKPLEVPYAAW